MAPAADQQPRAALAGKRSSPVLQARTKGDIHVARDRLQPLEDHSELVGMDLNQSLEIPFADLGIIILGRVLAVS